MKKYGRKIIGSFGMDEIQGTVEAVNRKRMKVQVAEQVMNRWTCFESSEVN